MTTGTWWILCQRAKIVSLVDIGARLTKLGDARITEVDAEFMEIVVDDKLTGNQATIEIYLETEAHVAEQAAAIAAAADCDARYEMSWDLEFGDETYNTMALVSEVIAKACDGVVYDRTTASVVWSARA